MDKISEETYRRYLSEFSSKYSEGTKIRSNAYPELDGQELRGQYILEIPASNANLSNIDYYEKIASEYELVFGRQALDELLIKSLPDSLSKY